MFKEEVYLKTKEILGANDDGVISVCDGVYKMLEAKLKDGVSVSDCREEFVFSASSIAALLYGDMKKRSGTVSSYSAGSVSVHRADAARDLERLLSSVQILMLPYLKDSAFSFIRV